MDPRTASQVEASEAAGSALATYFAGGGQPQPISVPFRLQRDEFCVQSVQGVVYQWLEGDGSYTSHTVAFGGIVGIAAGLAASAAVNAASRSRAARRAAPAWRPIDQCWISLTNQRILVHGDPWWSVWFGDIAMVHCDGLAIDVQAHGIAALRFAVPAPAWTTVMLHKVAWDEVVDPRAGRDGPGAAGGPGALGR